jgi:hypothetical protein
LTGAVVTDAQETAAWKEASLPDIRGSRDWPRVALATIRIVNGSLGIFMPYLLARRAEQTAQANPAAVYAFRLFGIRTVLIGADLLTRGETRRHALQVAPLIHASDTAAALIAALRNELPRRSALTLTLISALNTALALEAYRRSRPNSYFDLKK